MKRCKIGSIAKLTGVGIFFLLSCLLILLVSPASADKPAEAQKTAAQAMKNVTVQDLEELAATLESDRDRERLLRQIRALIALQRKAMPVKDQRPFSERVTATVMKSLEQASHTLALVAGFVPNLKSVSDWLGEKLQNPRALFQLSEQGLPVAFILALAWISEWVAVRLLSGLRKRLEAKETRAQSKIAPWGPAVARAAVRLGGPAAFAVVAALAFIVLRPNGPAAKIAVQIYAVYLTGRIFLILARMVLAPSVPNLRLVSLRDRSAVILFAQFRRLSIVGLTGYLFAATALLFGLPEWGFSYLTDLLAMVLLLLTIFGILSNRKMLAAWIRGSQETKPAQPAFIRRMRGALASVFHILAILYLIGVFIVWWQNIEGGMIYLARGSLLTLALLFAARIALHFVDSRLYRNLAQDDELYLESAILDRRLKRYAPFVFFLLKAVIALITLLAGLTVWNVDVYGFLAQPLVRNFLASSVSVLLVGLVAIAIWETVNIAIEYYLAKPERFERTEDHGARVRTLLPLIRKALMIVLCVMVIMIVLSEIGLNIGPLLAGAGIIGLAVGFGAQKLVQDVITGVFILLEDSVSVGDVVEVAGIGGLVEDLSIRSIRLRDLSGNVHTIPFSSVGTVTNMTRIYSYYLADIGVSYREDTDRVAEVCSQIVEEMRHDPQFAPYILEPLEVLGVDRFADSAVIIKARIKTEPIQQWMVGREFNRRMKKRFDELGIEIPFPHRTLYFGKDKEGAAVVKDAAKQEPGGKEE
jgi:small conductance mechanosensitive channel